MAEQSIDTMYARIGKGQSPTHSVLTVGDWNISYDPSITYQRATLPANPDFSKGLARLTREQSRYYSVEDWFSTSD